MFFLYSMTSVMADCTLIFFFQKDPHQTLRELAKMAVMADCTLILAWRSLKIKPDFKKSFGINKTKLTLANHIRQIYHNNVSIKWSKLSLCYLLEVESCVSV